MTHPDPQVATALNRTARDLAEATTPPPADMPDDPAAYIAWLRDRDARATQRPQQPRRDREHLKREHIPRVHPRRAPAPAQTRPARTKQTPPTGASGQPGTRPDAPGRDRTTAPSCDTCGTCGTALDPGGACFTCHSSTQNRTTP